MTGTIDQKHMAEDLLTDITNVRTYYISAHHILTLAN